MSFKRQRALFFTAEQWVLFEGEHMMEGAINQGTAVCSFYEYANPIDIVGNLML